MKRAGESLASWTGASSGWGVPGVAGLRACARFDGVVVARDEPQAEVAQLPEGVGLSHCERRSASAQATSAHAPVPRGGQGAEGPPVVATPEARPAHAAGASTQQAAAAPRAAARRQHGHEARVLVCCGGLALAEQLDQLGREGLEVDQQGLLRLESVELVLRDVQRVEQVGVRLRGAGGVGREWVNAAGFTRLLARELCGGRGYPAAMRRRPTAPAGSTVERVRPC